MIFSAMCFCCTMQPQRQMICPGFAFFVWVSAPTLPSTRFSACSRTAQVLMTMMSAANSSSVKPQPISAR